MKNLVKVEPKTGKWDPGATKQAEIKGKLVDFSWTMTKQGYRPETIRGYLSSVRILWKRGANLYDPDSVKGVIAKQNWFAE
jgi:hypothetical protein